MNTTHHIPDSPLLYKGDVRRTERIFFTLFLCFINGIAVNAGTDNVWNTTYKRIEAGIRKVEFSEKTYVITKYGASVDNDAARNQIAINKAIDECSRAGGGHVIVPKGEWLTGAIRLQSGVNLVIEKGAKVNFSSDTSLYPLVRTRWEGLDLINYSPLVYAYQAKDIAVTGAGAVYQNNNCYPYGGMTALGSDRGYQQFKYNGKEYDPMHGLDEYDYGARQYDPAIGRFTTIDPLCEKYYHISPYTYCAGNPVRFVDLSGKEPTPAEAARIALQVYGEKVNLIGNWTISARTFKYLTLNTDNGLKSQIYERTVNGQKEYVYATAGTKTVQDWEENIKQPLGVSVEFHESVENARKISEQLGPDVELTYVGHSQGGGEAALNSLLTEGKGRKAITFNASGVGLLTKLKEGGLSTMLKSEKNINAYILLTDPLNTIQNSCSKLGIGLPDVNGLRHYLWPKDWKSILVGHRMTNIMKNF